MLVEVKGKAWMLQAGLFQQFVVRSTEVLMDAFRTTTPKLTCQHCTKKASNHDPTQLGFIIRTLLKQGRSACISDSNGKPCQTD